MNRNVDFRKYPLSTEVVSTILGTGTIVAIMDQSKFPILVKFSNNRLYRFSFDGTETEFGYVKIELKTKDPP